MLPVLAALVPLAIQLAPELARWFGGDRAQAVTQRVSDAIQTAVGTTDAAAAEQAIRAMPADQQAELRIQLATIAAEEAKSEREAEIAKAQLEVQDRAAARNLGGTSPAFVKAQISIGVAVLLAFMVTVAMVVLNGVPERAESILNVLLGIMSGAVLSVLGFFFGGSVGSQDKTGMLARMASVVPGATTNTIVQAATTGRELSQPGVPPRTARPR